jgi:hypothetical protein
LTACAAVTNGVDGTNGKDGKNAVSLNVSGMVGPNQCITLTHNLNRADLTFNAQFMQDSNSGIVYDWKDYKISPQFAVQKSYYPSYGSSSINSIATAAANGDSIAIVYRDVVDSGKLKFLLFHYSGYTLSSVSTVGPITVTSDVFSDLSQATNIGISILDSGNVVVEYATSPNTYNNLQYTVYDTNGNKLIWNTFCNFSANMSSTVINKFVGYTPVGNYSVVAAYNELTNSSLLLENKGKFTIEDLSNPSSPVYVANDVIFSANPVDQVKVASLGSYYFAIVYNDLTSGKAKLSIFSQRDGAQIMTTNFQDQMVSNISIASLADDRFMVAFNDTAANQACYMIFNCGTTGNGELLKDKTVFCNRRLNSLSVAAMGNSRFIIGYEGYCKFCDKNGNLDAQETRIVSIGGNSEFNLTALNQEDIVANYAYSTPKIGQFTIMGDTCLTIRKVNNNVVELWNRTRQNLFLMLSVNQ